MYKYDCVSDSFLLTCLTFDLAFTVSNWSFHKP